MSIAGDIAAKRRAYEDELQRMREREAATPISYVICDPYDEAAVERYRRRLHLSPMHHAHYSIFTLQWPAVAYAALIGRE